MAASSSSLCMVIDRRLATKKQEATTSPGNAMPPFHDFALLLLFLFLLPATSAVDDAASPGYSAFTNDASTFPAEASYDYIVVGGGTAGCPLAATLSESHTVLLLERGGAPEEYPTVMSQEGFLHTLSASDEPDSPLQTFTSEEGIPNARGRVLGGSSSVNAGFYSRAHPSFFAGDGAGTVAAWDMWLVNESYAWVEKEVAFRPHPEPGGWQSAVRSGLLEAMVTPDNRFTVEHVPGTKIGASTFDAAGNRHTAADLLSLAVPSNIQVALRATVERVLFSPLPPSDHRRYQVAATGVIYRDQEGRQHRATTRAGGEVILSAGALGSPQLLLLSGVGPWPYLMSWSIPVVFHSPDVGQYLYDNPRTAVSIFSPIPFSPSLIQVVGIPSASPGDGGDGASFIEAASSVIGVPMTHRFAFYYFRGMPIFNVTVGTILEKVPGPASVGSLRLAGLDVQRSPLVTFNYFANRTDLSRCVAGMRRVGDVLDSRPMRKFRWTGAGLGRRDRKEFRFVGPPLPEDRSDAGAMEEFCKRTLSTIWHYHGGCASGKVVDGEFRVIGVGSLRVVDGSVLRVSPGTNPQATLMMMGRYVGRKMVEERKNRS